MYASQMMNGEHQSHRFHLNREIIRASARDSPGAITKLSSTRRGSKGRRIPWSVGYQGETGLMKTKVGTEGRQKAYASTSISASSPREINDRAGCLFAGSFPVCEISSWSWETVKNSSRRLIVVVFFSSRHSERGKSTLELNIFLADVVVRDPSFPRFYLILLPLFLTRNIAKEALCSSKP